MSGVTALWFLRSLRAGCDSGTAQGGSGRRALALELFEGHRLQRDDGPEVEPVEVDGAAGDGGHAFIDPGGPCRRNLLTRTGVGSASGSSATERYLATVLGDHLVALANCAREEPVTGIDRSYRDGDSGSVVEGEGKWAAVLSLQRDVRFSRLDTAGCEVCHLGSGDSAGHLVRHSDLAVVDGGSDAYDSGDAPDHHSSDDPRRTRLSGSGGRRWRNSALGYNAPLGLFATRQGWLQAVATHRRTPRLTIARQAPIQVGAQGYNGTSGGRSSTSMRFGSDSEPS